MVVHTTMYLEYHTVVFCSGGKVLSRPEKKSSSRLSGGGCAVLVLAGNRFWLYIYYNRLGVPYSCGFVLVFLVLAGNSFWCYVRT